MYCPALSHLTVNDVNSSIYIGAGNVPAQPSGLVVYQTNNLDTAVDINEFFGLNSAGTGAAGSYNDRAMKALYGYQSTQYLENFIYAGKLDFRFVIPRANLTGCLFKGRMRLGQFFDSTSLTVQKISTRMLINVSEQVDAMQPGFTLQSAMVNDYLLADTIKSSSTLTDYISETSLGSEIIEYVVLQQPSINITTGDDAIYSLICEATVNAAVLPSPSDLLLYRTFKAISPHKQTKEIDYSYDPPSDEFLKKAKPPATLAKLKTWEKSMDGNMGPRPMDQSISAELPKDPLLEEVKSVVSDDSEGSHKCVSLINRRKGAMIATVAYLKNFISVDEVEPLKFLPALITGASLGVQIVKAAIKAANTVKEAKDVYEKFKNESKKGKSKLDAAVAAIDSLKSKKDEIKKKKAIQAIEPKPGEELLSKVKAPEGPKANASKLKAKKTK